MKKVLPRILTYTITAFLPEATLRSAKEALKWASSAFQAHRNALLKKKRNRLQQE